MQRQSQDITPQRIKDSFQIVSYEQIMKLKKDVQSSKEYYFSKQCFVALLKEAVELAHLHQSIKNINEWKTAQIEGRDQKDLDLLKVQFQNIQKNLQKNKKMLLKQLRENIFSSNQQQAELQFNDGLIQQLSQYCKDSEMKLSIHQRITESNHLRTIYQSITKYHSLNQLKYEHDQVHKSYLSKFQVFLKMYESDKQGQFLEVRDQNEIKHVESKLGDYITKSAKLLKNAQFYYGIVDYLKKFVQEMLEPLKKRNIEENNISYIVQSKEDIRTQFQRILQAYRQYIRLNDQSSATFVVQSSKQIEIETKLREEIKNLNENLQKKEAEVIELTLQNTVKQTLFEKAKLQNKKYRQKLSQTLQSITQIKKTNQKYLAEQSQRKRETNHFITKQFASVVEAINIFDTKLSEKQQIIQSLQKKIKIAEEDLEVQKQKYELLKSETYLQIQTMKESKKKVLQELEKSEKTIQNQKKKYRKEILDIFYEQFFNNEILFDRLFDKQYIYDTLYQRYNNRKIQATKLIYRYDPFNKVNFHHYIDRVPNILTLIKLRNGRILAAYTPHAFEQDCRGDQAILMVVNSRTNFYLKQGSRAISYDQYYIIYGNSEIRLRSGEDLLFSNFAIANSYFENNRSSVDALLGEGKEVRQVPIDSYEIYQVIFAE